MSKSDGITRSRRKVDTYKGFSIIEVLATHHWYNSFEHRYEMSRQYETKKERYFEFCKEGDENRPMQAYTCSFDEIGKCKCGIDEFLKDNSIYFTEAEREKYVYAPNRKCGWGYGYNSLMQIMREHIKADKRMKILLEDRLTDANFHTDCSFLCRGDYKGFEEHAANTYRFREKFEIITNTARKRLKNPEELKDVLKKVLDEVLAKYDTTVDVKFIPDW